MGGHMNTEVNGLTKTLSKSLVPALAAVLLLGACSPKKLDQQNAKANSIENKGDLFLDQSQIIGGEKLSMAHELSTHVVALYDTLEGGLCTGSIIADDIILTAGHCIPEDPANMVVLFGVDARKYTDVRPVVFAGANEQFNPHEGGGTWSDIALVYFTGGLPAGYSPIELLSDESLIQKGVATDLAGYGQSNGVKKTGSGVLRRTTVQILDPEFNFGEVILDQTQGKGACHGDSGGPAYVLENSKFKLWGVTSRGENDKSDDCSHYAVYTNAVAFSNWISDGTKAIHETADSIANDKKAKEQPMHTAGTFKVVSNIKLFR